VKPTDAQLRAEMVLALARHIVAGGTVPAWVPVEISRVLQDEDGAASQEAAHGAPEPRRIHGQRGSFAARAIARECNVSLSTATRVITLEKKAPDLFQQVHDGTMKLGEATRQLKARGGKVQP